MNKKQIRWLKGVKRKQNRANHKKRTPPHEHSTRKERKASKKPPGKTRSRKPDVDTHIPPKTSPGVARNRLDEVYRATKKRVINPAWKLAQDSKLGTWLSTKTPKTQAALVIGGGLLALTGMRLLYRSLMPENNSPPPGYQGVYDKISGMSNGGMSQAMRHTYSDFGSPMRHNKAIRRRIPKRSHNTRHRAYTGAML